MSINKCSDKVMKILQMVCNILGAIIFLIVLMSGCNETYDLSTVLFFEPITTRDVLLLSFVIVSLPAVIVWMFLSEQRRRRTMIGTILFVFGIAAGYLSYFMYPEVRISRLSELSYKTNVDDSSEWYSGVPKKYHDDIGLRLRELRFFSEFYHEQRYLVAKNKSSQWFPFVFFCNMTVLCVINGLVFMKSGNSSEEIISLT